MNGLTRKAAWSGAAGLLAVLLLSGCPTNEPAEPAAEPGGSAAAAKPVPGTIDPDTRRPAPADATATATPESEAEARVPSIYTLHEMSIGMGFEQHVALLRADPTVTVKPQVYANGRVTSVICDPVDDKSNYHFTSVFWDQELVSFLMLHRQPRSEYEAWVKAAEAQYGPTSDLPPVWAENDSFLTPFGKAEGKSKKYVWAHTKSGTFLACRYEDRTNVGIYTLVDMERNQMAERLTAKASR